MQINQKCQQTVCFSDRFDDYIKNINYNFKKWKKKSKLPMNRIYNFKIKSGFNGNFLINVLYD